MVGLDVDIDGGLDRQIKEAISKDPLKKRGAKATGLRSKAVPKKKLGAPTTYTEEKANAICKKIAEGKTLTSIVKEIGISIDSVYGWMKKNPSFSERYFSSRESMARSLTDELIDDAKTATPEEALLLKVKGSIMQWAVARFNPREFGDTKRLELSGQIDHRHTHELTVEQKQRIAESWLMSQQSNGVNLITAETSGPDLPAIEGVAVREICETEQGVRPQRKRTTPEMSAKAKGKPGRKPKAKPKVDLERLPD